MVDASLPAPELTLSEQPRTQIDASVFNRPGQVSIAPGLEQLGSGLEADADTAAKQQAATDVQKAVTRDASGNLVVATPQNSLILGQAGQDYHEAMVQGLRAQLTSNVSNDIAAARAQFPDQPEAFKAAADGVADRYRQLYPGVIGNAMAAQAQNEGSQYHTGMVEQLASIHIKDSLQAILTNIDDTNGKLRVLARQGAINTPEYDQLSDQLQDGYDALGGNQLFGYSQEKIDSEKAHASSMLSGEYVVGRIDDTFNRKGRNAALEAIRTGIDNNPNLDLSDPERNQLKNYALNRLSYLSDQQQTAVAALKPLADMQVKAFQSGNNGPDRVSDREFDQTFTQLQSLGAFKEAAELQNAKIISDRLAAVRNLAPDQKAVALSQSGLGGATDLGAIGASGAAGSERQAIDFFTSKGWTPAQAAGIVGNLSRESGLRSGALNPGDGSDGSDSIGLAQWNGPRAAALKAFAGEQGKSANDFGTQLAFVQHELETSEGNAAAMLRKASTPQDAASAFALGYERPQGFLTGDINQVAGGKDRVAAAVRLAGGNVSSAPIFSGPGGGVSQQTSVPAVQQPFTDDEAAANPGLRLAWRRQLQVDQATQVQYAKAQFETLDNAIKFAGAPTPDMLGPAATALQIADRYPDQLGPQAAKLRGALVGQPAGFAGAGMPDGGATMLEQAEELVRKSPGDRLALSLGEGIKTGLAQGKKLLAEDPFEYARQSEWIQQKPPAIDLSSPASAATLPQAMQLRGIAATAVAQHAHVAGVSALAPADLPQVKSVMTSGTLDQRMAVLGSIAGSGMSEPILRATLGQLAGAKETLPLAVAGSLMKDAPEAARSILQGQMAMQTEPKLAPNKDDFPGELAKVIPFNDLAPGPAREGIGEATQAIYAKLSADAGDTTGVINSDRVQKAVDMATGGTFAYRGAKAIAPWYGATQANTDAAIRSLTDADFASSRGSDGVPLPAAALKPSFSSALGFGGNWRLQSYGDGKYLVFSGEDTGRQYLQDARGGKFILDLAAKRAQAMATTDVPPSGFQNVYGASYLGNTMGGPM